MKVQTGLENILADNCRPLRGQRVGLISQSAAVLPDFTHGLDALIKAGVKVTALFGPEHGFRGAAADGAAVEDQHDPKTGLPVYSLYGSTRQPTLEMLADVDTLVFDMQDVGVRFYTYLSTLYYGMAGAAAAGKPFWVFDRPNPLGGVNRAGPLVEPGFESFIGIVRIPIVYGLTLGELAGWMNDAYHLGAELHLAPMQGWSRGMRFDETGLPWVPTSPAMPHLSTVRVYPGACLIEGTNLSEGRGTALPFEVVGAPWLDGETLASSLNRLELPGARFRPVTFSPTSSKHSGQVCSGVQVHVTRSQEFLPIETFLHVIAACRAQAPAQFAFLETSWEGHPPHFDLAAGNAQVREQILAGVPVDAIGEAWRAPLAAFERDCADYLRYA